MHHLDIEADDLDAEVKRLEAPTGHRFCVVRPQKGPLELRPHTNTWGAEGP